MCAIKFTTNNSSYSNIVAGYGSINNDSGNYYFALIKGIEVSS